MKKRPDHSRALSIIVPIYNEEDNIKPLYDELMQVCTSYDYEIIYVNDGSTDNSLALLNEIANQNPLCIVINLRRNSGQTAAMMAGFDHCCGDAIVLLDGDLQNDPADIPRLLEKLDEGFDLCSGWRQKRKDTWLTKKLPSMIANKVISKISGVKLKDYGCTLKAYKREVLADVQLYGEMHRFLPIYAGWQGAKTTEIAVNHRARIHGTSNYGLERIGKVILDLLVVTFLSGYSQKPIYLFGGFGLLNHFFALITFIVMIYFKFWGGKDFIATPLPLVATLFFLMGFISILLGLIAELLIRTYHESQNKPTYHVESKQNFNGGD